MLEEKVKLVEDLLSQLDTDVAQFQGWSGLHCPTGCGKCCFKADIEATVLEFLPFAWYLHSIGEAELWRDRLLIRQDPVCVILDPFQPGACLCSQYKHRGLICRLFGYSARTNKYQKKELVTCQVIKTEQTDSYERAAAEIEAEGPVPVMTDFYFRLQAIDGDLAREFYPINVAIRMAIEKVMHYWAYRENG